MRRWSEVAERIASTTRTSEKTHLLAAYLQAVDADALGPAVVFFSGRAFAEADGRALGLGWATLADVGHARGGRVARRARGRVRPPLRPRSGRRGRPAPRGEAADARRHRRATRAPMARAGAPDSATPGRAAIGPDARGRSRCGPTVPEVAAAFAAIEAARGPAAKAAIFEALLRRCDPLTATYVVKILGGELRIGLREGLVEAAIAAAFEPARAAGGPRGDADRRHGRGRASWPATIASAAPGCASSTRSASCSRRPPRTRPRS